MASSVKIPSHPASIILILLIITTSCHFFADADEALMQSTCRKTSAPDFCLRCLRADPQASRKDVKGLAITAINCGLANTASGGHQLAAYKGSVTDPSLKAQIDSCIGQFLKVADDLTAALNSCRVGNYKAAEGQTAAASRDFTQCGLVYGKKVPPNIAAMFFLVNGLLHDAHEITQQAL